MDRRAAGALLALAACIASSAAAPTVSNQTALDIYDAASEGCYYNFQHYGEGDRIMTNEPCLNCTCHNRMLMCYLRVCPFTKPIGQDCTVEKRADQCCPIVTCPDVPVDLLTSTSTSSPAEYGATGLGKLDKYGCSINGKYFPEGSKVPPTPNKPCEHCYCIRNMTTCVMQECTLHVDGCTPIYHKDVCCPVRYSCDHPEDEMPLLDDMSTTVRPTPGFLLTTTTLSPVTQMTQDCVHNDQIFPDGTSIKTEKACEHCYCMKGDIVCVVQECGTPMENEGKNCTSVAPREGQCCPDTYICEGDEVTTELTIDYTTEPFIEKLTTLVPPRRVLDEGSGYRKEEEPIATELPIIEPEVEGSGEEFATVQPSDGTQKETPSLFDERISSTEDVIGRDTTPQSDIEAEKLTTEPDSELNTVPSGTIEPLGISEPQLTTVSDDIKSSEGTDQTHVDSQHTTASIETKGEEISAQTTEPTFKKEDESPVPIDITTAKEPEYYSTTEFEPTKTKDEGINTTEQQEPVATVTETKFTTPASSEDGQTETETVIPITTARDELDKEPSFTVHDHTTSETPTMIVTEKSETTTLNAQENEIEDVSTTQGPGRIPGEGDCLQNGITYRNESVVPSMNNCQTDCKCISSIIKCDPIICSDPPEYMSNCVPTYDSLESCCPTYVCDGSKETLPPQPHSQMSEITSSTPTPAFDCEGDQCEIQKADKYPEIVPSDIPQTGDCGSADCKDVLQTPVPMEVQPECTSEDCGGEIQPEPQNKPSTISPVTSESCSGSECQQQPAENEDSLQSCEGENCKTPSIQRCQNEEDCKTDHVPEDKLPCEGESCKLPPESHPVSGTICEGENCKVSPLEPCQNEDECKLVNVPKLELPCEGESCKLEPATETTPAQPSCEGDSCDNKDNQGIECVGEVCKKKITPDVTGELPTQCSDEGCEMSPQTSPVGPICEGDSCKIPPIEPSKVEKPCEGESCKLEPTECNDEGCKTAPETSPIPTCEGENCKISPNEPCQNEDECKLVNVPKLELPCEGESCKLEPATETTPAQPSCEGDSCDNKDDQGIECVGEECKNKITPDVTGELPTQCDGTDCLSEAPDSPEKTDVLSTEVPLSTQDKDAETPAVTTEYLDSTKSPEFTNTETPLTSEAMGEGSTDKSVEVTELEPAQTKYSTEYPERKTTEYEVIKETTPVSDLEIQTEGIHELEVMTTPHLAQDISNKEPEISQTTELVTNYPELQESAKPSEEHEVVTEEAKLPEEQEKPEETSETTGKQEKDTLTTVLPETKLETETTEPAIYETPAQFEQETSPESTSESEISTNLSLDEQYTAVPKLDSEKEATTESNVKSTEHSVLDDKMEVSETETTKDSEETSKAPVEIPVIDEKISTTPSVILDISTEESRSGTPAAPESPTTSSDEPDELYSKTELPDFEKQEPIPQTTSVPEPQTINQEPDKKDDHTTDKLDIEPSTSQASIIFKTDEPDTETPIVDKHKIPDLPSEEVFTESPEINTEEPSYTAHHDEASPQEPIEPESPYIPVYPTISDNLGSDLIDKEVTPGIVPELASSTEKSLYSTASELIPEVQTQEPSVTSLSPKIEDDTKTTPLVDTEQYEHDMRTTEPSVEISPTDTRKYNKDTTESPELITTESPEPIPTGAVLTTTYPTTEEKQTESSVYSELTTSKPLQEKEQFTTEPADIFNTEKQEVMPTETPESHVKETESEFKLSTVPEMVTTEKLRPIETEEPQTTSPSVTEPTESQSPSESVEMEKESDENLGKATSESPKQTSEPKYEYSETTPDMIELVEHNEISTLPSSITDERITVSPDTEKSDDNLATETPLLETDFEKVTSTSHPLSEDTEDKIKDETLSTPSDITKDNEAITNPQDVDSHETDDNTTLKPESEDTKPESIPVQVTTTEIIQINKDHSTELPDITSPEQITEQAEGSSTEMSEISDTHTDELTTKQPEVAVTDFRIKPEDELATEEPGSGEMEVKPDKDYLTEKPEIEQVPTSEYESSSLIPEQPSVDIQPVTDKSKDTTPTEVPKIDNEIQPEKENIEPTIPSLSETEKIPGEDIVTVEPEYAVTKAEDLETVQEEFTTENPTIPGIKPEVGSSTEHQLLPDEGVSTGKYDIAVTEKETLELTTQKPEPELPEIESSSSPAALEDGNGSQSSTAQPESVTLEQSMTTEKEFVTELSETSEPEQETKAPGTKDDIQPDSESLTISPEKEYTTARPKVDLDTTIKTPTISSEPSDVQKEPEHTTDSKLSEPEHKLPSQEIITEQPGPSIDRETVSTIEPTERVTISEVDIVTEEQSSVTKEDKLESSTEKMEEQATISLEPETETTKPDITEEPIMPELGTKEPEISENIIPEHATEPQRQYTTDNLETSSIEHDATSVPILIDRETSAVTEHGSTLEQETGTKEPQEPEEAPSSEQPVHVYETTIKTTNVPFVDSLDDKESSTTKPENIDDSERLSTIAELSSESSTEKEELSEKSTEAPESHGDSNKHDEESNNSTTPGYTMRDETTDLVQETEKPTISEEGLPVHPQPATEKPTDLDLTKDTTAPEEEFLTVTTKATTPKAETETPILSEDLDKTPKPQEPQEETSSAPTSEIPKPGLNEVQATDEVPVPEEEGHFPPSATGGYGQEPDYEDENQPFGPGTCRYGGKVYVSAQQIPRDDPCDFCFCFRSDIICLQQSCPPPIHGCHEEPIQGFCCPRYECPVSMASTLNITTTTTTTTTTLPPHFLPHAYQGAVQRRGCQIKGHTYKVGEVVRASSGPCLHCTCGGDGQMKCDPKACTPEPMLRQMIAAAVSAKRRR